MLICFDPANIKKGNQTPGNPEFAPENCFGRMNIYIDRSRPIEFIQNL